MATSPVKLAVAGPVVTPAPYGLLSVVQMANEADAHWRGGVKFQADACDEAGVTGPDCPIPPDAKAPTSDGLPASGAEPFTVFSWINCSTPGFLDEARTRTLAALTNGEARAVEREFWTGAGGTRPHLAEDAAVEEFGETIQSAATVISATALDVTEAVARLEAALRDCYGGVGVIHAPVAVAVHMLAEGLAEVKGERIITKLGTLVAAGGGYPGTSPAGLPPVAGTLFMYGTGAVKLWRSEIVSIDRPAEVVDRAKNSTVVLAERDYVIGWDCCHFGVAVSTSGEIAGTFGTAA